ncbi:Hypothetical protein FKW44_010435 [Caligus rogercresseyi]|uniref:Histone-lysine N-methyltransferase SETMAR n=1 Tax=Caligus rogercresseyi TaxID=217165 RepID=A0A7T8HH45_CALRO|nr:Hypothetical protein FKW44_010435 [Caligus rogercresseyi]
MWDNARPHTATDTREFLTRRDVEPVKQSLYSPDPNLCDRFLFRKLKQLLREDDFGGHEEATLAVQGAMRRVNEDELYVDYIEDSQSNHFLHKVPNGLYGDTDYMETNLATYMFQLLDTPNIGEMIVKLEQNKK